MRGGSVGGLTEICSAGSTKGNPKGNGDRFCHLRVGIRWSLRPIVDHVDDYDRRRRTEENWAAGFFCRFKNP